MSARNIPFLSLPIYTPIHPLDVQTWPLLIRLFPTDSCLPTSPFCVLRNMPLKSLNEGCASITGYRLFIRSPGVKLPPSSKQSHLPQRILLICKGGACKAARCSALMPRRDSLLKLSLSSFFAPMSQGDFSTYPHSVHFSGHGIAPPAISTASVSDPCHVSCLFKQKGGFMLHKKGHGTSSMSTRLGMKSRDARERVVVRTGQLVCFNSLFLAVLISVVSGRSRRSPNSNAWQCPSVQDEACTSSPPLCPTSSHAETRAVATRIAALRHCSHLMALHVSLL